MVTKKQRENFAKYQRQGYSKEFLRWWAHYPRKLNKPAAFEAFNEARSLGIPFGKLMAAVMAYESSDIGQGEPRFICHAVTWLHQHRWEDDPASWNWRSAVMGNGKPKPKTVDWDYKA